MLVYTVRISGIKDGSHEDYFDINGKFFESFVNYDITNCEIKVISMLIKDGNKLKLNLCLLYTSPSPRDGLLSRMPSSA